MGAVNLPLGATNSGVNDWADVHGEDQAIVDQVNGQLDNTNIKAGAGIAYSKLASMSTGAVLLGNAGTPTATALSGDATVNATGVLTIANSAVTSAKILDGTIAAGDLASNAVTTAKITDANVTDAKLASPNNSVYKTIAQTPIVSAAALTSGTNVYWAGNAAWSLCSGISTTGPLFGQFDYASGSYTVGSLTAKLRVVLQVYVGNTSPSTVTFNGGLYPVVPGSGALSSSATPTVTAGSTTGTSPTPALATNTVSRINGSDFSASAVASDPGTYALGFVVGSITVPAGIGVSMALQTRNV